MSRYNDGSSSLVTFFAAAVIIAAAIIFAATSCEDETRVPPSGVVSVRGHRKAWVQPVTTGKVTTMIHHPERWWLVLIDDQGEKQTINVSARTWESVEVGDYYAQGEQEQ